MNDNRQLMLGDGNSPWERQPTDTDRSYEPSTVSANGRVAQSGKGGCQVRQINDSDRAVGHPGWLAEACAVDDDGRNRRDDAGGTGGADTGGQRDRMEGAGDPGGRTGSTMVQPEFRTTFLRPAPRREWCGRPWTATGLDSTGPRIGVSGPVSGGLRRDFRIARNSGVSRCLTRLGTRRATSCKVGQELWAAHHWRAIPWEDRS